MFLNILLTVSKIQIGFTFLVLADLGSPGKRAIKQVCVTVSGSVAECLVCWTQAQKGLTGLGSNCSHDAIR